MTVWIDAQLSPALAQWLKTGFGIDAIHVRELGLRSATDREIFFEAKKKSATVMTKDSDFISLLDEHGSPPQVIWITCGNTSNAKLKEIFRKSFDDALKLLASGESLVEISDIW